MNQYNIEVKPPVKINYVCQNCGRKRTITYTKKCSAGGLLSNHNEQCMPYMECPRCNKRTMRKDKSE